METLIKKNFRIWGNLAVVIRGEKVAHEKKVRMFVEAAISGPSYLVKVFGSEENIASWAEEMDAYDTSMIDHEYYSKWEE